MLDRMPFAALCVAAVFAASAAGQDQVKTLTPEPSLNGKAADKAAAKADLAKVQGTWVAEVRDPRNGKPLGRVVKYIRGNKEMVVQEALDGKIASSHHVEFEVNRLGAVRLFTYYNGEVTDGPQKGQKMGPYTYIYKVDDQTFTEVMGMLVGQEKQTPSARMYKKVENADANAPPPPAPPPATPDAPDPK